MDEPGDMLLVAFGFTEEGDAQAAETTLRSTLDVGDADLAIARVGGDAGTLDGHEVVLAARIREGRFPEASEVAERYGGELLTEVPEAWS